MIVNKTFDAIVRNVSDYRESDMFNSEREAWDWIEEQQKEMGYRAYSKVTTYGTCDCGQTVVLNSFTVECPNCGKLYNAFGQELRPREEWEETDAYEENEMKFVYDPARGTMVPEKYVTSNSNEKTPTVGWHAELRRWLTKEKAEESNYSTRQIAYTFKAAFPKYQDIDIDELRNEIAKRNNDILANKKGGNEAIEYPTIDTEFTITISKWFSAIDNLYDELVDDIVGKVKEVAETDEEFDRELEVMGIIQETNSFYQNQLLVGSYFFKHNDEWDEEAAMRLLEDTVSDKLDTMLENVAEEKYSKLMGKETSAEEAPAVESEDMEEESATESPAIDNDFNVGESTSYQSVIWDLKIQDKFKAPVKEYVDRFITSWKDSIEDMAQLYICLNHMGNFLFETNEKRAEEYFRQWERVGDYVYKKFAKDKNALRIFFELTD